MNMHYRRMRQRIGSWWGAVVALVALATLMAACDGSSATSTGTVAGLPQNPVFTPAPDGPTVGPPSKPPTTIPPGVPGLKPTSPGQVPAFTADAMSQFVTSPGIPGVGGTKGATVSRSSATISGIIGYSTGFDASAPLGYVELSGSFDFPTPPTATPIHLPVAYMYFDATNGNVGGWGGLKAPSNPNTQPTPTPNGPTPTPVPGQPTPTPAPGQPTPTPAPKRIYKLIVKPTEMKQDCTSPKTTLPPYSLTLDATGSTAPLHWAIAITDTDPLGAIWASASPTSGTLAPGATTSVTITPGSNLCLHLQSKTTPITYHITITYDDGGNLSSTDTVLPPV